MQIEKLNQANFFRNPYHKAQVNILFTCNWIQEKVKLILLDENITPQQYNILRILKESDSPLSTLKIRERMLDKMSDTSRIVDRLLKKELVSKTASTVDRRLVDVIINDKGKDLLIRLDGKNDEIDAILSSITNAEAEAVISLLDKIRGKI